MIKWNESSSPFEWGFEQGEQAERERIIALLKNSRKKPPFKLAEVDSRHRWRNYHDMFIALIKGEEA